MVSNNPMHPEYQEPEPDPINILDVSQPIANKDYACWHCGQPILRGIRHTKVVYTEDDKFKSIRYHIFCRDIGAEYEPRKHD
jgi:hypothetical protein